MTINHSYSAQARSKNGATDGFVGTASEINHWLSGWADPQNLYVTIEDEHGQLYREKPFGKKKIKWTNVAHIKEAFEPGTYIMGKGKISDMVCVKPLAKDMVHINKEVLENEIAAFMQKHIFDGLCITIGTLKSYISISSLMKLPTAFLEHTLEQLELILSGDNLEQDEQKFWNNTFAIYFKTPLSTLGDLTPIADHIERCCHVETSGTVNHINIHVKYDEKIYRSIALVLQYFGIEIERIDKNNEVTK